MPYCQSIELKEQVSGDKLCGSIGVFSLLVDALLRVSSLPSGKYSENVTCILDELLECE